MKQTILTLTLMGTLAGGGLAWAEGPAATWTQKVITPEIALKAAPGPGIAPNSCPPQRERAAVRLASPQAAAVRDALQHS